MTDSVMVGCALPIPPDEGAVFIGYRSSLFSVKDAEESMRSGLDAVRPHSIR